MVSIKDLQKEYDFDLDSLVKKIKSKDYKSVLLQFPDGLKHYSNLFIDFFEEQCKDVNFAIWLGSCFGACDVPKVNFDLIIQIGHSPYGVKVFNELN